MKKFVALLCAGILLCSSSLVAFAASSPSTTTTPPAKVDVYTPSTGDEKADFAGTVAVYETVSIPGNANAVVVVAPIADAIVAEAKEFAVELNLSQEPFAYVDVNVSGYTPGTPVTIPFNLNNIVDGETIVVLHRLSDGTWETLVPDSVENGKVVVTFTSLSPVVFVRGAEADALLASPKTADLRPMIMILAVAMIGLGFLTAKKAMK
ncbi:MAG: hypothetical protein LBM69_00375 [Lachnospiraceae bacterium]|jgi:hypothetical protein|nr:hypothetical protein [Lachnospiraceae bacterium]